MSQNLTSFYWVKCDNEPRNSQIPFATKVVLSFYSPLDITVLSCIVRNGVKSVTHAVSVYTDQAMQILLSVELWVYLAKTKCNSDKNSFTSQLFFLLDESSCSM